MKLILASRSAARITMLRAAGVAFEARAADLDEDSLTAEMIAGGHMPDAIAAHLAEAKARAIGSSAPEHLVLGSDQVLVHDGDMIGKSGSMPDARRTLGRLRGATHILQSAACLVRAGKVVWQGSGSATLTMRCFSDAFLDAYLQKIGEEALGSVGCYQLEGLGSQLFDKVEGDYFTILGMPLLDVLGALRDQGIVAR